MLSVLNVNNEDVKVERVCMCMSFEYFIGSRVERLALYNAITGKPEIASFYGRLGKQEPSDVKFELLDLDKIPVGDPFNLVVKIEVSFNRYAIFEREIEQGWFVYEFFDVMHFRTKLRRQGRFKRRSR